MRNLVSLASGIIFLSLLLFAGCSGNDEPKPIDCSASDLALTFEKVNPESCALSNGSITISATGGKAPYTYALNAGLFSTTSVFTLLSAGDYVVRVKDKNGCIVNSVDIELRIPGGNTLTSTVTSEADTECVGNNGSITVTAVGGTEPYQYKIGSTAFGSDFTFASLAPGNYSVTVQDAAGCIFPKSVTVNRGNTGVSLKDDIIPIINANCAVPDCHAGSESPDFRNKQNILTHATNIRKLTQSGEMPRDGTLSAAEKALIACWVDDGATNN